MLKKLKKYNKQINLFDLVKLEDLKNILSSVYCNRSGYITALSREDQTLAQQNIFLTYGEILPEGLESLFKFIKPTQADSFVDLGTGVGKAVIQSYLASDIRASYGVEIDPARYNKSCEALAELKQYMPSFFDNNAKFIEFYLGNITDFDFNLVSIVFCNATCFGPNLMGVISDKINNSLSIRAVMSTCRIDGLISLTQEDVIQIAVSWHTPPNTSPCYVYTRNLENSDVLNKAGTTS